MPTLISFLRGVNMAGHNSIKMTELALLYNDLGFIDAETYIQSGNVIFRSSEQETIAQISQKIEMAIFKRFNYKVPLMVRTIAEIRALDSYNPFLSEENFDSSRMAVMFLHEECSMLQLQKAEHIDYPPDKFKISGSEIFIYCPNGFGRTKLYTNFFEKKMGVTGTARNWNTITTILNIAEKK
jgi:uncharacterized protein (DUF1697 family)